jgi:hypothetical protein
MSLFWILILSGYQPNSALHALFGVVRCTLRIILQNSACSLNLVFVPFCKVLVGEWTLRPHNHMDSITDSSIFSQILIGMELVW